eukprot:3741792-Amphidinium_carterae.1
MDRYSASAWPLIYQAEVRARLELSKRLRHKCQLEYEQAMSSGAGHAFDPTVTWELVFQRLVEECPFWKKEVEEPAILYLTKTASLHQMPLRRTSRFSRLAVSRDLLKKWA